MAAVAVRPARLTAEVRAPSKHNTRRDAKHRGELSSQSELSVCRVTTAEEVQSKRFALMKVAAGALQGREQPPKAVFRTHSRL